MNRDERLLLALMLCAGLILVVGATLAGLSHS
jgi:hypothetical protein